MSRTRWLDIAAIALSVAVLAGLFFVSHPRPTSTLTTAPSTAHVDRPQPALAGRPSALVIGDSYAWGNGLAEMSYGCMAAAKLGLLCHLSGGPGTGYVSGGPGNRFTLKDIGPSKSFDERLPGLAAEYQPSVVILDGGRNDVPAPHDAVFDAMASTIADVRQNWPTARIVFIRPRLLTRPNDDLGFGDEFFARLLADPAMRDVVVVDPINRLAGTNTADMLEDDGIHPNRAGDLALSSALVDSLRDHGFAPTT
ncbi:MAG TPA: SGNH/GDSL hydrolase family protein [Mycobacterium sp.]